MDSKHFQNSWQKENQLFDEYWRYAMFIDYLQVSESYSIVQQHKQFPTQVTFNDLPADHETLLEVYNDFSFVALYNKNEWWKNIGMALFGIQPDLNVRAVGILSSQKKAITVNRKNMDELVLAIPLALTETEVITKIRDLLSDNQVSFATKAQVVKSKYTLTNSRISKKRLINGLYALEFFKQDMPLWAIGNKLALIPSQCFDATKLTSNKIDSLANKKYLLSVAARRLIEKAGYIAENAARGIFPCEERHEYAIIRKRTAGRRIKKLSSTTT